MATMPIRQARALFRATVLLKSPALRSMIGELGYDIDEAALYQMEKDSAYTIAMSTIKDSAFSAILKKKHA
jgi:hypothetical protein